MPYTHPRYNLTTPSETTQFKNLGKELRELGTSLETVLANFDYNGADPNLVLSRVVAIENRLAKLPKDMQGRATNVPCVGGVGVYPPVTITFDRPFGSVPVVDATPSSPVATVGVSAITTTGFTITVQRAGSTTTTTVQWKATEF